jgi:hypothetical protein
MHISNYRNKSSMGACRNRNFFREKVATLLFAWRKKECSRGNGRWKIFLGEEEQSRSPGGRISPERFTHAICLGGGRQSAERHGDKGLFM